MTKLPGDRAERQRNFHGADGKHLFPHPEQYGEPRSTWTPWMRRYADHLNRHAELALHPEPQPGDGPAVEALFAHIEKLRQIIRKEEQLIVALRQQAAMTPAPDPLLERRVADILEGEAP